MRSHLSFYEQEEWKFVKRGTFGLVFPAFHLWYMKMMAIKTSYDNKECFVRINEGETWGSVMNRIAAVAYYRYVCTALPAPHQADASVSDVLDRALLRPFVEAYLLQRHGRLSPLGLELYPRCEDSEYASIRVFSSMPLMDMDMNDVMALPAMLSNPPLASMFMGLAWMTVFSTLIKGGFNVDSLNPGNIMLCVQPQNAVLAGVASVWKSMHYESSHDDDRSVHHLYSMFSMHVIDWGLGVDVGCDLEHGLDVFSMFTDVLEACYRNHSMLQLRDVMPDLYAAIASQLEDNSTCACENSNEWQRFHCLHRWRTWVLILLFVSLHCGYFDWWASVADESTVHQLIQTCLREMSTPTQLEEGLRRFITKHTRRMCAHCGDVDELQRVFLSIVSAFS